MIKAHHVDRILSAEPNSLRGLLDLEDLSGGITLGCILVAQSLAHADLCKAPGFFLGSAFLSFFFPGSLISMSRHCEGQRAVKGDSGCRSWKGICLSFAHSLQ